MMLLDSDYYLIAVPAICLSAWARWRIYSASKLAKRVHSSSGMTGAAAARQVIQAAGMGSVEIEPASGQLADHYDPGSHVLRLSHEVASGRSLAALGIAAHEAGHVLQHAARFPGLLVRSAIVPTASLGSTLFWMLMLAGFFLGIFRLIVWGVFMFWGTLLLQLINLPIELDASRRARSALLADGLVTPEEESQMDRVLNAAAWSHVAGVLTSAWSALRG